MRARALFLFAVLICCGAGLGRADEHGRDLPMPLLVSPAWLDEHGNDQHLVLLHMAYTRGEYRREHIAGARFLWFYDLVQQTPEAMTELPPPEKVKSVLESLGVGDDSKIVLCYSGTAFVGTARIFYTLDAYGLGGRTAILNGGLEAWKAEKRPVTAAEPTFKRARLTVQRRPECTVTAEEVQRRLHDANLALVDARSKQAYDGTSKPPPLRPGHITGATNLPVTQVTDSLGYVKDPEQLAALFAKAGAAPGKEVVTYCGVGQSASGVYFAARLLGMPVQLYDGSMDDWMYRDESYPVEVSPPPAAAPAATPAATPAAAPPAPVPAPPPGK
jgi:thiosulfate/3-mercaptopyruvate sulfurtransferase